MSVNDELGKRMKEFYESVSKIKLVRRMPVIIRIDGKAFHTFTRGFQKPFDQILMKSMQETAEYLAENIQGCVASYVQSDEISLLLIDYKKLTTSAWFDYEVQKICSISASMATRIFNRFYRLNVESIEGEVPLNQFMIYDNGIEKAMFDSRCFNVPKEEVSNYFIWRQLDASRNSVQMVGQANFSHKELQGLSCNQIQEKLFQEKGINWNDFSGAEKCGTLYFQNANKDFAWDTSYVDLREDRSPIENLVYMGE